MTLSNKEKDLFIFFAKLFLIWISWKGFVYIIGEEHIPFEKRFFPSISQNWENFNYKIVRFLALQTQGILQLLGYETYNHQRIVWIAGYNGIGIGNYCIGFQLMYYFFMLIAVSQLNSFTKLWAAFTGILITQVLNVIRLVVLSLVTVYIPDYIFLFHDHIFNIIVFGTLITFYYHLVK